MYRYIRKNWDERPLLVIMGLAILFRLLAAIFAKGWGMLDDHFIVIESSQSWADGQDCTTWLPTSQRNHGPTGHNLVYPGIHYLLFTAMQWMGVSDPQWQMFFIRLLHGAFSLITVFFGFKLTERLDGRKSARMAGILLALFWFMPWMSVRNLVEMTSVPFLMMAYWYLSGTDKEGRNIRKILIAGIMFGLAINIRPQTILFPVGTGLVILFQRKWKDILYLTIGTSLPLIILQGGIDYLVWGRPFAELIEYARVNITEREMYIILPWYNYFLTVLGMLIPPLSLFLFFGFLRDWKKHLLLFVPIVIFFALHSYLPNKQERFIIPMIPFFILLGSIGWNRFAGSSKFWDRHRILLRSCWIFFWILNTIALMVMTFTYSKRSKVEAMSYLSAYPDIGYLMILDKENNPELFPIAYLGQWPVLQCEYSGSISSDSILSSISKQDPGTAPRFILFTGKGDLQPLIQSTRRYFPYMIYETTIQPGLLDQIVYWLNPANNESGTVTIYRNSKFYPVKKE